MPSSKNNSSAGNDFRRGFKAEAERIAVQYRKDLGLKNHEPLSSFKLAEHLGLRVITPSEIPGMTPDIIQQLIPIDGTSTWSAITIGIENPSLIIHNNSHAPTRIESNIMHECAHVILGHEMDILDTSFGLPLRSYDQTQEKEAEWLGGCLQLPKSALIRCYIYQKKTLEEIGQLYTASVSMVKYRISMSGVSILKKRL